MTNEVTNEITLDEQIPQSKEELENFNAFEEVKIGLVKEEKPRKKLAFFKVFKANDLKEKKHILNVGENCAFDYVILHIKPTEALLKKYSDKEIWQKLEISSKMRENSIKWVEDHGSKVFCMVAKKEDVIDQNQLRLKVGILHNEGDDSENGEEQIQPIFILTLDPAGLEEDAGKPFDKIFPPREIDLEYETFTLELNEKKNKEVLNTLIKYNFNMELARREILEIERKYAENERLFGKEKADKEKPVEGSSTEIEAEPKNDSITFEEQSDKEKIKPEPVGEMNRLEIEQQPVSEKNEPKAESEPDNEKNKPEAEPEPDNEKIMEENTKNKAEVERGLNENPINESKLDNQKGDPNVSENLHTKVPGNSNIHDDRSKITVVPVLQNQEEKNLYTYSPTPNSAVENPALNAPHNIVPMAMPMAAPLTTSMAMPASTSMSTTMSRPLDSPYRQGYGSFYPYPVQEGLPQKQVFYGGEEAVANRRFPTVYQNEGYYVGDRPLYMNLEEPNEHKGSGKIARFVGGSVMALGLITLFALL